MHPLLEQLKGGLIVSCQALEDEPLHSPEIMARMAVAAVQSGAVGIRCNSPEDTHAIREAVDVPVIGLWKQGREGVYITPTAEHAVAIAEAGADIVAMDATRLRTTLPEDVAAVHAAGALVMADVSTFEEGLAAVEAGVDCVGTTLSGYTDWSPKMEGPDLPLVHRLSRALDIPVIAEGRINTPDWLRQAFEAGAYAAVVGSAITRPQWITRRFVDALGKS